MYEAFFKLKGKPFELLPDPDFLYPSPAHRKALTYLDYGIKERAGFILLTGEVGSGKTTIIKNIIKRLDTNVTTSKVFNTGVTVNQLLALINDDFGMESAGKDKITLIKDLNDFLIREFVAGRHCLLLIDEAQNLSAECLEEVRMLSNLETESSKLLQIILIGQPELRAILAADDMRQLRQRISVNCHIPPLDRVQTEAYILHRLERAGNRNAVTFTDECLDIIQQQTRGIPRLINIMCDFLLVTAFTDETTVLSGELVREIAADLRFDGYYWNTTEDERSASASGNVINRGEEPTRMHERLHLLETAVTAMVRMDDIFPLMQQVSVLEETVQELWRQSNLGAEQRLSTPFSTSIRKEMDTNHLVSSHSASSGGAPWKSFFRSLAGGWRDCLKRSTLLLVATALLLYASPVRADAEQAPSGSVSEGSAGVTAPRPDSAETTAPAPPTTPVKPAAASGAVASPGSEAYLPANPGGALGAGDYLPDVTKPIIVPRSGGLPSLMFENKAENWFSAGMSIDETFESNVLLRSVKQEDFITKISPSLAFKYQNRLLDWSLGSSLDYRYYARDTRTEDYSYALNTAGTIKVYREYAFITVSDTYTQTSQSNVVDYSALSSTVNVTDLNTLSVTPRMELPLTSRIRFNPRYTYTNSWYPSKSSQNRQNYTVSADCSYELSPRLMPALGYSFVRMEGSLLQYTQQYPFLRIAFQDERFAINATLGYSSLQLAHGQSSNGIVWDTKLTYMLSSTTISLAASSDMDQNSFLNDNNTNFSTRKTPELVTNYSMNLYREFSKASLALSIYFREATDAQFTNVLSSRRFGASLYLKHTLSSRLSGKPSLRLERSDQRKVMMKYHWDPADDELKDYDGPRSLLYQLGYELTYRFGNDWNVVGAYSYTNSCSLNNISNSGAQSIDSTNNNYTNNKISVSVSKSF